MSTQRLTNATAQSSLAAWTGTIAAYGAACLLQILAYGLAATADDSGAVAKSATSTHWPSEIFEITIVLVWLLGPATLATWFSARILGFWKHSGTDRLGVSRALAMLMFPVLSSYLGAVVSINIWGT